MPECDTKSLNCTNSVANGPLVIQFIRPNAAVETLPRSGEIRVGRSGEAEISIDDPSVSRMHARFRVGATIWIEDLGSRNGTRVKGRKLEPRSPIEVDLGDLIEMGSALALIQPLATLPRALVERRIEPPPATKPIVRDARMEELYRMIDRVARGDISVLLLGETGVGKDVVANAIHSASPRRNQPLLTLNCAALSPTLLESELFGHEKGAFTGAEVAKVGLLESACGGTVFLDEVGELPLSLQSKLLRVLEDRAVLRVGGLRARTIDVRFIAATNRELAADIEAGRFRSDLFYRLDGISLAIPPLRERRSEIEPLARSFLARAAAAGGYPVTPDIGGEALELLLAHHWPGNIRELRNVIERAALLSDGDTIDPMHLAVPKLATFGPTSTATRPVDGDPPTDRDRVLQAMEQCGGNQTRAAKLLGISRNTLSARLNAYGIRRPRALSGLAHWHRMELGDLER